MNNDYDDSAAWGPYDTPDTMYPEAEYLDEVVEAEQAAYEWGYDQ